MHNYIYPVGVVVGIYQLFLLWCWCLHFLSAVDVDLQYILCCWCFSACIPCYYCSHCCVDVDSIYILFCFCSLLLLLC